MRMIRKPAAGFTMMELLLGIAILAILTTLAVPSFTQFIQNNRLASEANELVAAFQFARSEALKRGIPTTICSSSDGSGCGGGWADGWLVATDPNAGDPEVLRVWQSPGDDFQFTPDSGSGRYLPQGCLDSNEDGECTTDDAGIEFDLELSGATNLNNRRVFIERTGRVASCRLDEDTCES